ncbi:MAG: hypothetical protein ACLPV2_12120 [Steroidobacteraceae bacterium]
MKQISKSLLTRSACALALGLAVIALPEIATAQISVSITLAPPALPVYEQPVLVEEGGIWAPGYWDYTQGGYFWVPGAWVQPPEVGLLWTPGYWGWGNGGYAWNAGYWGPTVGFYGGIAYGFGYSGQGYTGGHWQGQQFYYNTEVSHVNVTNIHNVYRQTVVNNNVNRVSYNGGTGGVRAQPNAAEQAAAHAPHQAATAVQTQHRNAAMTNHGKSEMAATPKPIARAAPVHAADLPPVVHQAARSTGNVERDTANQRARDDLSNTQEKQRQELQQRQVADHQKAAKQPAVNGNDQALERQHQAQTQALAQRHTIEQKSLQETQEPKTAEKHEAAPHG